MKYVDRKTAIHTLDPRTKILMTFLCAILIVFVRTPAGLAALSLASVLVFGFARPPVAYVRTVFFIMLFAFVATIVTQGFFYYFEPKTPVFTILDKNAGLLGKMTGGIALYKEGVLYGAIQSMRLFSATMISTAVVMTTHPSDMLLGLSKLKLPDRAGLILLVSIRFFPLLFEQGRRIMTAQKLRGMKYRGFTGALKSLRYLMVPLVIESLRTARRVAIAAELRAFGEKRVPVKNIRLGTGDYMAIVIMILAAIAACMLGYLL